MSLESQLERICVALEALAAMHACPVVNSATSAKEVKKPEAQAEPKAETKKAEPATVTETAPTETNTVDSASLEDLAEKVKALAAKAGRDAVIEIFTSFKVKKLSELDATQYIAMDIALAKAITKANAG